MYRFEATPVVEEFTALAVGLGESKQIAVFDVTRNPENPEFKLFVDAGTAFEGSAGIAVGDGHMYLVNGSGIYRLDHLGN